MRVLDLMAAYIHIGGTHTRPMEVHISHENDITTKK
jgi:hypothetical protein